MARIVFIGAGDVDLLRRIVSDLLLAPALRGELEIVLYDDDPGHLATAEALVRALDAEAGSAAMISVCPVRRQALDGADFVVGYRPMMGRCSGRRWATSRSRKRFGLRPRCRHLGDRRHLPRASYHPRLVEWRGRWASSVRDALLMNYATRWR